jgi:hypothetical protein
MTSRRMRVPIQWLVAAALLLVTASALQHELDHALEHHDEPSCALHLFADHTGKTFASATPLDAAIFHPIFLAVIGEQRAVRTITASFQSRAPPASPA